MSLCRKSKGSQANTISSFTQEQLNKSGEIYNKRKDIIKIRERLQNLVTSPKYWITLATYIHGGCSKEKFDEEMAIYLPNNESKILHNELIRSILFNAHFSTCPPPGYVLHGRSSIHQKPKNKKVLNLNIRSGEMKSFHSFSAVNLRHIPTIIQLSSRLSQSRNIIIDNDALNLLFLELKQYILSLLQQSVSLSIKNTQNSDSMIIHPTIVLHALKMNPKFSSILTPSTISKIQLYSD